MGVDTEIGLRSRMPFNDRQLARQYAMEIQRGERFWLVRVLTPAGPNGKRKKVTQYRTKAVDGPRWARQQCLRYKILALNVEYVEVEDDDIKGPGTVANRSGVPSGDGATEGTQGGVQDQPPEEGRPVPDQPEPGDPDQDEHRPQVLGSDSEGAPAVGSP